LVFSSAAFLFAFLPLTLGGYYFLPRKFRNVFLMLASLFFYAWGEPKFVLIMILSIGMNYVFGLLVARREEGSYRKIVLTAMVVANLSVFFVFKYLNFTIENLNYLFGGIIPQTHIRLPIGISFFTFQAMSYVFDVALGRGEVQKNPFNVVLYIALFPQLIAGPIVRYETVAEEIGHRQENLADFAKGADLLLADGLFPAAAWAEGKPHLSAAHCAQLAQDAGAKKLVITHLNPVIDPETLLKEARAVRIDSVLARIGDEYEI